MSPAFVHTGRLLGQGVPILNRAHPLAQNLLAAYVPSAFPGGTITNLASPGLGDLTTRTAVRTGQAPGITPDGVGLSYLGTIGSSTASATTGSCPVAWQKSSGLSLFARGKRISLSNANHTGLFVGVNCSSSPFNCYLVGGGGNGTVSSGQLGVFYTSTNNFNGSMAVPVGPMFSAGATFPSGAPPNLYVNGVLDPLNGSPTNTNITYAGTVSVLLGEQGTNANVGSTLTVGYI
jgi:hypothetical protein